MAESKKELPVAEFGLPSRMPAQHPGGTMEQLTAAHARLTAGLAGLAAAIAPIEGSADQTQAFRLFYWPLQHMAEQVESMLRAARRFQPLPGAARKGGSNG